MMLNLVTDPGGVDSNSYIELEDAEEYMSSLLHAKEWTTATDERKTAAIIQAARWLNTLTWKGTKSDPEQSLSWPRRGVVDDEGFEIPSTSIPRQVKDANAEFAYRLLVKDRAADAKKGKQMGDMRTADEDRQLVPPSVMDLLGSLVVITNTIRVVRSW